LQLGLLAILEEAGLQCHAVVGHSSGEIAAAVAAGWLTPEQAIMVAYYRGKAISETLPSGSFGMMAVGLEPEAVSVYLEGTSVEIGCINSPKSITLSGRTSELSELEKTLTDKGHFARRLRVDVAYHSRYMKEAAERYMIMLTDNVPGLSNIAKKGELMAQMFSSTTGEMVSSPLGPSYWARNMSSTVLFNQALHSMIAQDNDVDQVIEIGPSSALAGPVGQIMKAAGSAVPYASAWARGRSAMQTLLQVAGRLFTMGCPISLAPFNQDDNIEAPRFISDLPNYCWNHSTKYWHETAASRDWRFRRFLHHDLLGTKILGTPWKHPVWKKTTRLADVTWLQDHRLGESVIFPGAGYLAMAMEAIFQKSAATGHLPSDVAVNSVTFKLRNVYFHRMLALDESRGTTMELSLRACYSTRDTWHEFVISSAAEEAGDESVELCRGLVTIGEQAGQERPVSVEAMRPLVRPQPASVWYKAMSDVGLRFGPAFKRQIAVEATAGSRTSRARIDLAAPESRFPQSLYPLHPTVLDACFQTSTPSLSSGHRSAVAMLSIPAMIDDLVIYAQGGDGQTSPERGIAVSTAKWSGEGRRDDPKQLMVDVRAYEEEKGGMLLHLQGLRFHTMQSPVPQKAPHTYAKVVWREDVHFLTPRQMSELLMLESQPIGKIAKVAQLCAHKNPSARILEVELGGGSGDGVNSASLGRSIWIDQIRDTAGQLVKNCAFRLSLSSQMAGMEARRRYTTESNIEYALHDPSQPFEELNPEDEEEKCDLVLLRVSSKPTRCLHLARCPLVASLTLSLVFLLSYRSSTKGIST
jgi:acyl transferase domain-containing protein